MIEKKRLSRRELNEMGDQKLSFARHAAGQVHKLYLGGPHRDYAKIREWRAKAYQSSVNAGEDYARAGSVSKAYDAYSFAKEIYQHGKNRDEAEEKIHSVKRGIGKNLGDFVRRLSPVTSMLFLFGALMFVSFNITGNAIADLSSNNMRIIGVILFVLGLILAIIYLKSREGKKSGKKIKGKKKKSKKS